MQATLFYLFSAFTMAGAIGVLLSRHIVHAAVQLLLTLLGIAGLYLLLDAEFLAAAQLVIYVGGTLVLIIFGVMLTSHLSTRLLQATRAEAIAAAAAGLLFFAALLTAIFTTTFPDAPINVAGDRSRALGESMLGTNLLPFEAASVLLLAVMIGAAYLARKYGKDVE